MKYFYYLFLISYFLFPTSMLAQRKVDKKHKKPKKSNIEQPLDNIVIIHDSVLLKQFANAGERPKIGVVLSGGGAKGIAHVGILKKLEELKIPIDYIAGTSMGSIVGGLYALGYSADELDALLRKMDWGTLLTNKPKRFDLSMIEKKMDDSYLISLPLTKFDKMLPKGILNGQYIDNAFYFYTSANCANDDFSKLNIPFFCMATNLANGSVVKIDKGNLAQAMRASMAVPVVFSPVEVDGMLLVDGGVLNNFPVEEMIKMGADIIIGVDVGITFKDSKQLNNLMKIFEQTIFLASKPKFEENKTICNIYIKPDLTEYTAFDFSKTDSLLSIGASAAKFAHLELEQIAELLSHYQIEKKEQKPYQPLDNFIIDSVHINGLNVCSKLLANQYLQIYSNKKTNLTIINDAINRLYGTRYFTKITYELKLVSENHYNLILHCTESHPNSVHLGFQFENLIRNASVNVGFVFRDLGIKRSRLSLDLHFSSIPVLDFNYLLIPKWHKSAEAKAFAPRLNLHYRFYSSSNVFYSENDSSSVRRAKEMQYSIGNVIDFSLIQFTYNHKYSFGIALDHSTEWNTISENRKRETYLYWYPFLNYEHHNFNAKYFPTKGGKTIFNARWINNVEKGRESFLGLDFQTDWAIKLHKKWTLYLGCMAAINLNFTSKPIPLRFQYYQGGYINPNTWLTYDFVGLNYMQSTGLCIWNAHLNLQFSPFKKFFVGLRTAVGWEANTLKELGNIKNAVLGFGATVSYLTPIGPITLGLQDASLARLGVFVGIGYWF